MLYRVRHLLRMGTLRHLALPAVPNGYGISRVLETLADQSAYRGGLPASPNLFCLWQKRVLIRITLFHTKQKTDLLVGFCFGGRGWIRTTEAESSRFTVCPLWPLGNSPKYLFPLFAARDIIAQAEFYVKQFF